MAAKKTPTPPKKPIGWTPPKLTPPPPFLGGPTPKPTPKKKK